MNAEETPNLHILAIGGLCSCVDIRLLGEPVLRTKNSVSRRLVVAGLQHLLSKPPAQKRQHFRAGLFMPLRFLSIVNGSWRRGNSWVK
jgi:hypothetical protein